MSDYRASNEYTKRLIDLATAGGFTFEEIDAVLPGRVVLADDRGNKIRIDTQLGGEDLPTYLRQLRAIPRDAHSDDPEREPG